MLIAENFQSFHTKKKHIHFNNYFTASACYQTKGCENAHDLVALLISRDANVNEEIRREVTLLALGK